jgi:hypothetical protein
MYACSPPAYTGFLDIQQSPQIYGISLPKSRVLLPGVKGGIVTGIPTPSAFGSTDGRAAAAVVLTELSVAAPSSAELEAMFSEVAAGGAAGAPSAGGAAAGGAPAGGAPPGGPPCSGGAGTKAAASRAMDPTAPPTTVAPSMLAAAPAAALENLTTCSGEMLTFISNGHMILNENMTYGLTIITCPSWQ